MHIFVISLPDADDRRAFVREELGRAGLDFEFVDAVRGKDYYEDPGAYDKAKALRIELRNLTAGEVGCALSHQKVYRLMAERGLSFAMVMEDDAIVSPDLPEALRLLEPRIRPNDLVQLERCDVFSRSGSEELLGEYKIVRPRMIKLGSMCQSAGYVITREAADKILAKNDPVYVPADSWGQYVREINFRGIVPTLSLVRQNVAFECTTQDYQRSEFTPSTPASLVVYWFKTRTAPGRFLMRTAKRLLRRERR